MAVAVKLPDVGQGHAVEGVVFAGGVDGHVSKENQVAFLQFVFKGVLTSTATASGFSWMALATRSRFMPREIPRR